MITIVTHFLFKNWERNSKYNVETLVDLTSRNHYYAEEARNIFLPTDVSFIAIKTMPNAIQ